MIMQSLIRRISSARLLLGAGPSTVRVEQYVSIKIMDGFHTGILARSFLGRKRVGVKFGSGISMAMDLIVAKQIFACLTVGKEIALGRRSIVGAHTVWNVEIMKIWRQGKKVDALFVVVDLCLDLKLIAGLRRLSENVNSVLIIVIELAWCGGFFVGLATRAWDILSMTPAFFVRRRNTSTPVMRDILFRRVLKSLARQEVFT